VKLRKSQTVMHTEFKGGRNEIVWHTYIPTETGVEQYIDNKLRATVDGDQWAQFVDATEPARRAQQQDDAEAGVTPYERPTPPRKVAGKRRR
jgi:hypothetical protein